MKVFFLNIGEIISLRAHSFDYTPQLCNILLTNLKSRKNQLGTSLVAQWLRIRLPVQGTRVRPLVREDHATEQLSPCATTTEPAFSSPQATTAEARAPRAHAPQQEKPPQ